MQNAGIKKSSKITVPTGMGGATSVTEEDTGNAGGNGTTSNDVSSEPSARQDKNEGKLGMVLNLVPYRIKSARQKTKQYSHRYHLFWLPKWQAHKQGRINRSVLANWNHPGWILEQERL